MYGGCGGWSGGCWGGLPVSYGCYGSGWMPVTSGWYGSGCYGSSPVMSYGCYGSAPVVSYGCCGGGTVSSGVSSYGAPVSWGVPVESGTVRVVKEVSKAQATETRQQGGPVEPAVAKPAPSRQAVGKPTPASEEATRVKPAADNKPSVETLGPPENEAKAAGPATIVVRLPAQASLSINDRASKLTSPTRKFVSPPLQPGKDYYYTLKAEIERDGRPVTATQRVAVHAGEEKQVLFEFPTTAQAAK
jgi:uncharacterized protein (TIGR03000 family)